MQDLLPVDVLILVFGVYVYVASFITTDEQLQ